MNTQKIMTPLKGIKNIIFDLGGVVIDLDRNRAVARLQELGLADADDLLGLYRQDGIFLQLETGKISAADFFDHIQEKILGFTGKSVSCTQIQKAFNAFLIDIPVERLQTIRRLRDKGYRTFVLSNTNPVMYDSWIKEKFRQEGLEIDDYFDGIVKSFSEGMCKPNVKIFEIPLHRYSLNAEETVMLDDSEENCEGARKAGMRAVKIDKEAPRDMVSVVNEFFLSNE